MAEVKNKVVTVESLKALHDYDEDTFLKMNGALTTLGVTATADELNYIGGATSNIQTQLDNKAASNHTHSTNVIVQQTGTPYVRLNVTDTNMDSRLYKNANAENDYGTSIADYASDGTGDSFIIRRESTLADKLSISVANEDGSASTQYFIYGEHNKPTPSEIGAAPSYQAVTAHMDVEYYALPTGGEYNMLPLSNAIYVGDAITMTNNRIKIGSGVSKVRISAQVCVGSSNRTNKMLAIRKNGTGQIARAQMKLTENTTAETMSIAPVIVSVSENDLITLDFYGEANDTIYGGLNLTYITVEKMA